MPRKTRKFKAFSIDELSGVGTPAQEHATVTIMKAVWTTAYVNRLPDSAFLHVEGGGKKDDEGKTVPRSLRHFPYKDDAGAVDLPHLRNALSRIPQATFLSAAQKDTLSAKASKLLGAKTKTTKSIAALTTASDGHAHLVELGEQSGTTSYTEDHSHPFVVESDGTITIGEAMGHSHTVAATPSLAPPVGGPVTKEHDMEELQKLKDELAKAQAWGELSDAEKAYAKELGEADRTAFVAAPAATRQATLAKAADADPVVYTTTDGTEIRKSAGDLVAKMARDNDELKLAVRAAEDERYTARIEKQASEICKSLAGADAVKIAVLKAIDTIADAEVKKAAHEMLRAANGAVEILGKAHGVAGTEDPASAGAKIEKMARERMAKDGTTYEVAYDAVSRTPEGEALILEQRQSAH